MEICEYLKDKILEKIKIQKISSSGWYIFNAVCCPHYKGERQDTKKRGNIIFNGYSLGYNCFNCGFKTVFNSNQKYLTPKNKNLLTWMGFTEDEIKELQINILKNHHNDIQKKEEKNLFLSFYDYEQKIKYMSLDNDFLSLKEIIKTKKNILKNKNFIKIMEYLYSRGDFVFESLDKIYWKEDLNDNIIFPIFIRNKIAGFVSRSTSSSQKIRYINFFNQNSDLLYNLNSCFTKRKYIILVEGIFDALAIDGVSVMKNTISKNQIKILKSFGKDVIVVPDRDLAGINLIDFALENNYYVSLPFFDYWSKEIKDCADAAKKYGVFYTLKSILDSKTKDEIKIKTLTKILINRIKEN